MFSKLYISYILFIYMYTKAFPICFIKVWERTLKKKRKIGKQTKWNRSTEYEIEKMKQTRQKKKKAIPGHLHFAKYSEIILICIWILKSDTGFYIK